MTDETTSPTPEAPPAAEPSLRDVIASAFEPPAEPATASEPAEEAPVPEETDTPPAEVEAAPEKTEAPPAEETKPEPAPYESLPLSAAEKEALSKLTPEAQKVFVERYKAMEGDYTRKRQEDSAFRKSWESVDEIFKPHVDYLRAQGETPASVIQRWASTAQLLQKDPVGGLKWLASQYGVDPSQLAQTQEYEDPDIKALKDEITGLKTSLSQQQATQYQQRLNTIERSIEEFANQKDEGGALLHPHFSELQADMAILAQGASQAGQTLSLDELYQRAAWANPSVRAKLVAQQEAATKARLEQEARERAAAAKKAASSLNGHSGGASSAQPKRSIREELEAAFSGI